MDNELERMSKKAVVAYFKGIARHLSEGSEETHEESVRIFPAEIMIGHRPNAR
jgi:hypothetical protein